MNKDSIIFYKSFYESIKELPSENQLEIYNAIFEKYFFENDIKLSGISKSIFLLIVPNIDSANKRYFANIENGKKGGRPKIKKQEKPIENLNETQIESQKNLDEDVDEDEDEDVDEDVAVDEKPTFPPPTTTEKTIIIEDIFKQFKKSEDNLSKFTKEELFNLSNKYSAEKVLEAVKIAQKRNKVSTGYIEAILKNPDKNQQSEELREKENKRKQTEELIHKTKERLEREALNKATLNIENTNSTLISNSILQKLSKFHENNEKKEDEVDEM